MDVKKTIGNKKVDFYPEMIYLKLYAFTEMFPALLSRMNATGSYDEQTLDTITTGLNMISLELLTEMDQAFFAGNMERKGDEEAAAAAEPGESGRDCKEQSINPIIYDLTKEALGSPDIYKNEKSLRCYMKEMDREIARLQDLKNLCKGHLMILEWDKRQKEGPTKNQAPRAGSREEEGSHGEKVREAFEPGDMTL